MSSEVFEWFKQPPEILLNEGYQVISHFLGEQGNYEESAAMYSLESGVVKGYVLMEFLIPRDPCLYEDLKQSYIKNQVEVSQNFSQTLPSRFSLSLFEKRNKRFIFQTLLLNTPIAPYNQPPYIGSSIVLMRAKYPVELEAFLQRVYRPI